MDLPSESLRNKVKTFFREVLETAATRSCWWYGVRFDANDPDSLAQLCGITSIQLETMFVACGFYFSGKFSRDALTNFAKEIRTCDVTEAKPVTLQQKQMFLKVGTGATKSVATQYRKSSMLDRPSSSTRSLKKSQKRLQESLVEWTNLREKILQGNRPKPPTSESAFTQATIPVPPSTPPPMNHIAGVIARYDFLVQFIKPEALTSTDLWQDDVDEEDFVAGIEQFAAMRRKKKDIITSPIRSLLGAKKISETLDMTRYPLMKKKGINICDNMEIQALLRELVMLNDEVDSVQVLEYAAYNDEPQTLLRVPRSSGKDRFVRNAHRSGWIDKLLSAVLPEEWDTQKLVNSDFKDEDESGTNLSIAARWLIRFLGNMYPDEFIKAANDVGMPIRSQPMDQDQAFAMFRDANIGVRAARVIRKHFMAHFGTTSVASEKKIR